LQSYPEKVDVVPLLGASLDCPQDTRRPMKKIPINFGIRNFLVFIRHLTIPIIKRESGAKAPAFLKEMTQFGAA
jgi:hypothetical protein